MSISVQGNPKSVCDWCGGDINDKRVYRCSICGFCLDFDCVKDSPLLTITNPKSYHHPLVFFPRPFLLLCDTCGLVNISEAVYTCFQCNYMVHHSCISLTHEIKITCHPHRLSYTPYFPSEISTCKICYKTVDIKYIQYFCYHEGCSYVAHSKCATHENVWDGSELEWEPEETNEIEDIAPFEKVGVDVIKYFCHEHHLKLQKYDRARDEEMQCQACIFPMDTRDFYSCMQCDFYLHEVCASLPRKLNHASHHHPLFLDPSHLNNDNNFCSTCHREFIGFKYKCSIHDYQMDQPGFKVDIRCILVTNCFTHKCHEHSLFINTCFRSGTSFNCNRCKWPRLHDVARLECALCEFIVALPFQMRCTTNMMNIPSPFAT